MSINNGDITSALLCFSGGRCGGSCGALLWELTVDRDDYEPVI